MNKFNTKMKENKHKNQILRKFKWMLLLLSFATPGLFAQINVSGTVTDINVKMIETNFLLLAPVLFINF